MDRLCRLSALAPGALTALALAIGCAGAVGCAGPPISSPIEGIPVCPDFTTGNARMEGGLRFPVRLRVLDGKTVLYKTIISGLRTPDAPKPHSYIADDNAKHTVEWAQCGNPRAPRPVTELAQSPKAKDKARDTEGTSYECGEATVYKGDGVMELKKGDRASHVITFVPPPNAECWAGDAPGAPAPAADAGAAAAAEPADAGATGDAGPAPATDAGAAHVDAGAHTPGDGGAAKPKP